MIGIMLDDWSVGGGRRQFILMTEGLALFRDASDGSADLEKLEEEVRLGEESSTLIRHPTLSRRRK